MASGTSKSQLIAEMKNSSRGGWQNRRKNVEPKGRGAGGWEPNLKGLVGVCKSWGMGKTQSGDIYFKLTLIVKDPTDYEGRRATQTWFLNKNSDYKSYEQCEDELMNDLALMTGEDPPEDQAQIPEILAGLCEQGVHMLFNTGPERDKGRGANVFIQGPAEGWENDPQEGAGEEEPRARRQSQNGQGRTQPGQRTTGGQPSQRGGRAAPAQQQEDPADDQPPEVDEPEPEAEPEADAEPEAEPQAEEEAYIPKPGDKYKMTYKKAKLDVEVTACDPEAGTVDLKQIKVKRGEKALTWKKVKWEKLEA